MTTVEQIAAVPIQLFMGDYVGARREMARLASFAQDMDNAELTDCGVVSPADAHEMRREFQHIRQEWRNFLHAQDQYNQEPGPINTQRMQAVWGTMATMVQRAVEATPGARSSAAKYSAFNQMFMDMTTGVINLMREVEVGVAEDNTSVDDFLPHFIDTFEMDGAEDDEVDDETEAGYSVQMMIPSERYDVMDPSELGRWMDDIQEAMILGARLLDAYATARDVNFTLSQQRDERIRALNPYPAPAIGARRQRVVDDEPTEAPPTTRARLATEQDPADNNPTDDDADTLQTQLGSRVERMSVPEPGQAAGNKPVSWNETIMRANKVIPRFEGRGMNSLANLPSLSESRGKAMGVFHPERLAQSKKMMEEYNKKAKEWQKNADKVMAEARAANPPPEPWSEERKEYERKYLEDLQKAQGFSAGAFLPAALMLAPMALQGFNALLGAFTPKPPPPPPPTDEQIHELAKQKGIKLNSETITE